MISGNNEQLGGNQRRVQSGLIDRLADEGMTRDTTRN